MTKKDHDVERVTRLLRRDIASTLGAEHEPIVDELAAVVLELEVPGRAEKVVEDVQQYFQDNFVDVTWPACPRHPNHPLEFRPDVWYCPRDGMTVARLGELASLS
jgi:hypothetical protein